MVIARLFALLTTTIVAPPERITVRVFDPGVTATIVAPEPLDPTRPIDLILYALPNGNTTAETMGRALTDPSIGWRYDIQHIAAQTRALRERGYANAVVVYLEAEGKSWPAWRAKLGYPVANAHIVRIVDELRAAVGDPATVRVTLTGHSGGGSFAFGFIEGQDELPDWLERIAFLDSNYNFEARHTARFLTWLGASERHRLVVLAYDDREIMLDGKNVVSDSGGTWRATDRMLRAFSASVSFTRDTVGDFVRDQAPRIDLLRHPNRANRILHTEMIGEMNGYMHALLIGRPDYDDYRSVLRLQRAYSRFVQSSVPTPTPPTP